MKIVIYHTYYVRISIQLARSHWYFLQQHVLSQESIRSQTNQPATERIRIVKVILHIF